MPQVIRSRSWWARTRDFRWAVVVAFTALAVLAAADCSGADAVPELVDARVSPDGRLIAYAARDGDDLDLLVVDAAGGRPRLVAASGGSEQAPVWSPDSKRLAYLVADEYGYGSGPGELWVVSAAGGESRLLTDVESTSVAWSPDGRRIVFVVLEDDGDHVGIGGPLFVASADGRRLRRLAPGRRGDSPTWSPDGRRIAFWSGRQDEDGILDRGDLYLVGTDRGPVRRVTRRGDVSRWPIAWTQDGSGIRYTRELGLASDAVETVDTRSGRVARFPGELFLWGIPEWSRDGRWIAFDEDGLVVARNDGSARRRVDRRALVSTLTWSPDDRMIAYDTYGGLYEPIPTDVVVASLDGPPRNVTHTPELSETLAGWLADGRHVAVVREERSLWMFDLRGRGRQLVPSPSTTIPQ